MPKRPPAINAATLEDLAFQVNRVVDELTDYIEELCGVDEKKFVSQNDIDLNDHKIENLAECTDGKDAASKEYVDMNSSLPHMLGGQSLTTFREDQDLLTLIWMNIGGG